MSSTAGALLSSAEAGPVSWGGPAGSVLSRKRSGDKRTWEGTGGAHLLLLRPQRAGAAPPPGPARPARPPGPARRRPAPTGSAPRRPAPMGPAPRPPPPPPPRAPC